MQIETRPFGPTNGVNFVSDVESLCYLDGNLDVIPACSQGKDGRASRTKTRRLHDGREGTRPPMSAADLS